jgi:hypothetical protein
MTMWMSMTLWCNKLILFYVIVRALCDDVHLCNRCVREFWSWHVHGSHSVYLPKPGVTVGEAIWPRLLHYEACPSWASGESRVRPLLEEALGRGVNSPGTTVLARGWARARRDHVPWVDEALTWIAPISLCSLCWWWLPAVFRSVGGTPNYGTRQQ